MSERSLLHWIGVGAAIVPGILAVQMRTKQDASSDPSAKATYNVAAQRYALLSLGIAGITLYSWNRPNEFKRAAFRA